MGLCYLIFSSCICSLCSSLMVELQHVPACLPDASAWLAKASWWEYHRFSICLHSVSAPHPSPAASFSFNGNNVAKEFYFFVFVLFWIQNNRVSFTYKQTWPKLNCIIQKQWKARILYSHWTIIISASCLCCCLCSKWTWLTNTETAWTSFRIYITGTIL